VKPCPILLSMVVALAPSFAGIAAPLQSSAAVAPSVAAPANNVDYRVGPGDVLKITVYRAPDYDTTAQVASDGSVTISVIGSVKVAGLTPASIGTLVAERLQSAGVFKKPVVNVLVQEYHSGTVSILGNVTKPGEYPLERADLKLTDVLARAGAILGNNGGTIRLTKPDGTHEEFPLSAVASGKVDPVIVPRESVLVSEASTFYIYGEVQKAGSFPMEPGLTMGRAIAMAGGLTPRGSRGRVSVTHAGQTEGEHKMKARLEEPVRPGDLIFIGARIF
jgi:polysaccharide biosynthesis/export protein